MCKLSITLSRFKQNLTKTYIPYTLLKGGVYKSSPTRGLRILAYIYPKQHYEEQKLNKSKTRNVLTSNKTSNSEHHSDYRHIRERPSRPNNNILQNLHCHPEVLEIDFNF
jgi:hypothetical protein